MKDYCEELRVLSAGLNRMSRIFTLLVDKEILLKTSFASYIEQVMRGDIYQAAEDISPLPKDSQDADLIKSIDIFNTIKSLIENLTIKRNISLPAFINVGRLINLQIKNNNFLNYVIDRSLDHNIDKLENRSLRYVIRSINDPSIRKPIGLIVSKFFRMLNYLDCAKMYSDNPLEIKKNFIIFVLIHYEIKKIIEFMTKQFLYSEAVPIDFIDMIDGFIFSVSMDMKKIIKKELVGFLGNEQSSHLYTKIENSCGIMQNSIKQTVVALAQYFDKAIEGTDIFEDFQTKLEQSLKLREDIWNLLNISATISQNYDPANPTIDVSPLMTNLESFRKGSMKFLMFKDWYDFDNFYNELMASNNPKALHLALHKFTTYLSTLLKEVNKRAVLYDFPFEPKMSGQN